MIPWRLRFTGIRDYPATELDFSDKHEHILISGPNGAGKSTITFCMGAVLYSGKVAIDGLRSSNLPSDQTWRAKIELLFKNDGDVKVDAPSYVQFRLDIEQRPGEPIKREFYIEEGDVADKWGRSTKFTAGGKFNFKEYSNQVLHKYAVDPDAYYLIWYQKEVNQFAIMSSEERFRIFSEMNGIDKIQKNWEESKALVKETELTLKDAETKQKQNKMQLSLKKRDLDRFNDRNERLKKGYIEYGTALKSLEAYHLEQIEQLKKQMEELHDQKEETIDDKSSVESQLFDKKEQHQIYEQEKSELDEQIDALEEARDVLAEELKGNQDKRDAISNEIDEITKQVDRIGLSRDQVEQHLDQAKKEVERLSVKIKKQEETVRSIDLKVNGELNQTIAELNAKIDRDKQRYNEVKDLIDTYHSSSAVQEEMDNNKDKIKQYGNDQLDLEKTKTELEKELTYLNKNQVVNLRQEKSIDYFKKKNIDVFPLRNLLELDESAKATDEQLFDTIKYTLFVNKKKFQAPTDLYHVPLPNIIPDASLSHLPELRIKVKTGLTGDLYAFGVKALWWVRSFFEEGTPKIKNTQLADNRGIRGPQEEKRVILNEKVLKVYRENVQNELSKTKAKTTEIDTKIKELDTKNGSLFSRRESLKAAEAFLTKQNERDHREEKHRKLIDERERLLDKISQIEHELNEARTSSAYWQQQVETYQKHNDTYQLYEQEQDKIKEVQLLDQEIKQQKHKRQRNNKQLSELNDALDHQIQATRRLSRTIEELDERLNKQESEIDQLGRQIENRSEERLTSEGGYSQTKQELVRLLSSASYELTEDLPKLKRSQAEEMRERGKTIYDFASKETGIDEAAPENYSKMKEEYDTSANEVKKSGLLLDEHRERMEHFKEDLESTISMRILGTNQKFLQYMSLFGFEGRIEWDYMIDRQGQTRYRLYIKARKEGHRGKLEDVSEKTRGGKVGRGVSGGEESLSSLLFALALLQTIESSPGYIVLDEFDSALDEGRKDKVFDLYEQELQRKMIILTPKSHEEEYLHRFSKAYVVYHDSSIPMSKIFKVKRQVS